MDARRSEAPPIELGALGRDLMQALPGGAIYVERNGAIAWANAEAVRVIGLSYEALTKRSVADFEAATLHEDGTPCPLAEFPVMRALETGEPQPPRTYGTRRADGAITWSVFSALPVK